MIGKRELIALLNLSSWCLVMVERLFLAVPRGCLQYVIVVFPDHTHLLFGPPLPKLSGYLLASWCTATCLTFRAKIKQPFYVSFVGIIYILSDEMFQDDKYSVNLFCPTARFFSQQLSKSFKVFQKSA